MTYEFEELNRMAREEQDEMRRVDAMPEGPDRKKAEEEVLKQRGRRLERAKELLEQKSTEIAPKMEEEQATPKSLKKHLNQRYEHYRKLTKDTLSLYHELVARKREGRKLQEKIKDVPIEKIKEEVLSY